MKIRNPNLPAVDQLVKGRVYKLRCRNLAYGVWDGERHFFGIREKFGDRYIDGEIHWDLSEAHGTVYDAIDTGVDVPPEIPLARHIGEVDQNGRSIWKDESLENPMGWQWKGWYRYVDTNEVCPKYREDGFSYYLKHNDALFKFLDEKFPEEEQPGW